MGLAKVTLMTVCAVTATAACTATANSAPLTSPASQSAPASARAPGSPDAPSVRNPGGSVVAGRSITITGSGDLLIHNTLWAQAQRDSGTGAMDFAPQLRGVRDRIRAADFAICHQETPFAPASGPFTGYPVFSTPPHLVRAIRQTGYDACSTASNHTLDQGFAGIVRTLDALDAQGIGHSGSARTPAEAARPHVYDVGGVRVAHLAYAYGFNGNPMPSGKPWSANVVKPGRMIADARAARAAGAQIVVVSMHDGEENSPVPTVHQRETAAALAASEQVDVVIGHHVHVVQPVELIGRMWVAYGLGNLLSGQYDYWKRNKEGAIVSFTFTQQPDGAFAVTRAAGYPTFNSGAPIRVFDLVTALPQHSSDARMLEAYQKTRSTLLSMGAGRHGFVVPQPGR